ncbi:rhomboid family intramembrane serine protease [Streptomyces griseofuscus]|uniref:rhomboid family intramembrane serine protease n=1 Tax=Streptomyces griseofuscus TaxID=146922 RepID=UPI00118A320D|nr:rhomboid family intramembrane serine protease [Streptomyces rochei]
MTGARRDERTPAPEPRPGARGWRVPPVTATLFLVTGPVTAARFAFPGVLAAPPLLVPSPGRQALVTVPAVVALGIPAERIFGAKSVLALYLVPAAIGEAPGHVWQPHGSGDSIAVLGLAGAVADNAFRDIHGLPTLAGAVIGAGLLLRRRRGAPSV